MTDEAAAPAVKTSEARRPDKECDVVMRGGTTSGIVYPRALAEISEAYTIRGIGGTSAGAIGAAFGAAAEFGRCSDFGGFTLLANLPNQMGNGKLAALFYPQQETAPLLRLVLALTGNDRPGPKATVRTRLRASAVALIRGWPGGALFALPGLGLAVAGTITGDVAGWLLLVTGVLVASAGWVLGLLLGVVRTLAQSVPENQFGLCRGMGPDSMHPGLTDWLSTSIDELAALDESHRPLRFGQLWTGELNPSNPSRKDAVIDLRTVTTSISEGRAYEMPWDAQYFFYDPEVWKTLFPDNVMAALDNAPASLPEDHERSWEDRTAAKHHPPLRRLPNAEHLPVIVATRLSLSLPLIISAVPLWTIDRANAATSRAVKAYREAWRASAGDPHESPTFRKVWFTDGGMCSAFPLHMFDAALPARPTFAIDLGPMSAHKLSGDQPESLRFTRGNEKLPASVTVIPDKGLGAVIEFVRAALATSRDWNDSSHLSFPGYRDRIVQVLQSPTEGGLNLYMDTATINGLADRGRLAGEVLVQKFTTGQNTFNGLTGWDNHLWLRYRALLSCLPSFLEQWRTGRTALGANPVPPPSYPFPSQASQKLAEALSKALDDAAAAISPTTNLSDETALNGLLDGPKPAGAIRRNAQM